MSAHIIAVTLDEVKGIEDRRIGRLPSAQLVEDRQAVRPEHNRLAVDREAPRFDPPERNLFDKVVGANGTLKKEEGPPGLGGPPSTFSRTHLSAEPATSRATAEPAGR